MKTLLLLCRPGFEKECAQEIQQVIEITGVNGYIKTRPLSGFVVFESFEANQFLELLKQIKFNELIFSRQMLASTGLMDNLPADDRITPLIEQFNSYPVCKDLFIEYPDTNEGKSLSGFCKKFTMPFKKALEKQKILQPNSNADYRAHLFFLDSSKVYPGVSLIDNSSPWSSGIPRLKYSKSAPSRSTLKLDEAWQTFFKKEDQNNYLDRKMTAVDLGASPGGWTWQFTRRFIHVHAIDNGPMQKELMDSGLVTHLKVDGFNYRPPKPVTWMVCDIVESPKKVAKLISQWLCNGWCTYTIFNLKLPMKKRYQEVQLCKSIIIEALKEHDLKYEFHLKHLYHDREEVTGFIKLLNKTV